MIIDYALDSIPVTWLAISTNIQTSMYDLYKITSIFLLFYIRLSIYKIYTPLIKHVNMVSFKILYIMPLIILNTITRSQSFKHIFKTNLCINQYIPIRISISVSLKVSFKVIQNIFRLKNSN